jgi:hypothetical protein
MTGFHGAQLLNDLWSDAAIKKDGRFPGKSREVTRNTANASLIQSEKRPQFPAVSKLDIAICDIKTEREPIANCDRFVITNMNNRTVPPRRHWSAHPDNPRPEGHSRLGSRSDLWRADEAA